MEMKAEEILVTGASGFIGAAIVRELLDRGFRVRGVVRQKRTSFQHPLFTYVVADITDEIALRDAVRGCIGIVHCAGLKNDEHTSVQVNVAGARSVIAVAESEGVKWVINISTQSVKLPVQGIYASTKLAAEKIFASSKVPVTQLRLSLVYGPLPSGVSNLVWHAASHWPFVPVFGSGAARFAPVHVDDVAHAVARLIVTPTAQGYVYDVGGTELISFNSYIRRIAHAHGRNISIFHIPAWFGLLLARTSSALLQHPPFTVSNVLGGSQEIPISTSEFLNAVHFTPRDLSDALFEMAGNDLNVKQFEATMLLRYVMSGLGIQSEPDSTMVNGFIAASVQHDLSVPVFSSYVLRHVRMLGALDAWFALAARSSVAHKKFVLAASIVECSMISAERLLPQKKSAAMIIMHSSFTIVRVLMQLVYGAFISRRKSMWHYA